MKYATVLLFVFAMVLGSGPLWTIMDQLLLGDKHLL